MSKFIGYHFSIRVQPNWKALIPVLDDYALACGREPFGAALEPYCVRVSYTGTVDLRLKRGGLRYDLELEGKNVKQTALLGRTDERLGFGFGVADSDSDREESCAFSKHGLFLLHEFDERSSAVGNRLVAGLDVWKVLTFLVGVEVGTEQLPITHRSEFCTEFAAPGFVNGWKVGRSIDDAAYDFNHPTVGLMFKVVPMVLA